MKKGYSHDIRVAITYPSFAGTHQRAVRLVSLLRSLRKLLGTSLLESCEETRTGHMTLAIAP